MVVRLCVGHDVHVCGSERDGVLTPLFPFLGPDDKHGVVSPVLH